MRLLLDVIEAQRLFVDFKRCQRRLDQTNDLKVCNHFFNAGRIDAVHNAAGLHDDVDAVAVCGIERQHGLIAGLLVHHRCIALRAAAARRQAIEFAHVCRKALHLAAFRCGTRKGQTAHIHCRGLNAKYHWRARPNHLRQTNAG